VTNLKPWAYGPFEVLLHADMHYRVGEDFDRRIAMIGFDNAIEVAIATYLSLHPIQRANRSYPNADVKKWLDNFHTKIEFFFQECVTRRITAVSQHDEIVWFHEVRNGQYHVGGATVPQTRELDGVRSAAIEVFSVLFGVPDVDDLLDRHIAAKTPDSVPRTDEDDKAIDGKYGLIDLCGQEEYSSDVLHRFDPNRYRDEALEIRSAAGDKENERE
jgi:hypothetical protein